MQECSVGFILDLKFGPGKKAVFMKIDIDDLPIAQVELLPIRSKIGTFPNIVDLCPKHKLQLIDNYSHEQRYKCVDPFSIHKQFVKTNSYEVTLPEFHSMFSTYNVLPSMYEMY